jgi:long-subunit acyl-CoA synthetase (AMP-forming)
MGSIFANGIPVGIYPTNGKESTQYIVEHCKAQVILVENNHHLDKYISMKTCNFTDLICLVMWNEEPNTKEYRIGEDKIIPIYNWNDFIELGGTISDEQLEQRMNKQDTLNTIIKKYLELELKYGTNSYTKKIKCTCDYYAPFIKNGECRFCHGY